MFLLTAFLIAIGLAMDSFAVSLAAGSTLGRPVRAGDVLRMAGVLALFQGAMPFFGWLGGIELADFLAPFDHWIAFGLLLGIGIKMIHGGVRSSSCDVPADRDQTRGPTLILLGLATSIDALAVGLSFGVTGGKILVPCMIIGAVTALFSAVGLLSGRRLGCRFGGKMEIVGGVVLVLIGLKILLGHYIDGV